MKYIYSDNPVPAAARHLATTIESHLENNERVVWLLSGGSGVKVGLIACQQLQGVDLSNLTVTLTDERYGPLNHANENWRELLEGGLSLPGATLHRPLTGDSRDLTTDHFGAWLKQQIEQADYTIGLFGIGSDGHTAGIKPGSIAVDSPDWAAGYAGEDFERITMTFVPIQQIDEAVIQASGSEKANVLEQLMAQDIPLSDQPAQILKTIPTVTIYSDNKIE
ncbi:MAG: 6-phosphogluconolactonase [Candidatus Saccharimonadales bacterium]